MTTRCKSARRQIRSLTDGELLTPAERAAIDRHVAVCPDCARALELDRLVSQSAAAWARPSVADDPGDAFNAAVLSSIAARPAAEPLVASRYGWLSLASAAAAVLVGVAALLWQSGLTLSAPLALPGAPLHFEIPAGWMPLLSPLAGSPTILGPGRFSAQLLTPSFCVLAAVVALFVNVGFIAGMMLRNGNDRQRISAK